MPAFEITYDCIFINVYSKSKMQKLISIWLSNNIRKGPILYIVKMCLYG